MTLSLSFLLPLLLVLLHHLFLSVTLYTVYYNNYISYMLTSNSSGKRSSNTIYLINFFSTGSLKIQTTFCISQDLKTKVKHHSPFLDEYLQTYSRFLVQSSLLGIYQVIYVKILNSFLSSFPCSFLFFFLYLFRIGYPAGSVHRYHFRTIPLPEFLRETV